MGEFLKEGIKVNNIAELNICGLFLKDTCLSDLSTGYEKSISIAAWNGI